MKITHVEVAHTREDRFDFVSVFVHRGRKVQHYTGHSLQFFERAMWLLNLFYAQDR